MSKLAKALTVFAMALLSNLSLACTCSDVTSRSCNLLSDRQGVVFVGTVIAVENPPKEGDNSGGTARYSFRVDERFSGDIGPEVEIFSGRGGADCSVWFETGVQYVVFPYRNEDNKLWAYVCSDTQRTEDAGPLLTQLRAMRDGKPVARAYGTLRQTQQPYDGTTQDGFDKPLGNTVLHFSSSKKSVTVKTASDGTFAIHDLTPGKYKITAELSSGLVLAQTILDDPLPPLEIDASSCVHTDIEALPTARIRGQLIGDGRPRWGAAVELFSVDRYTPRQRGWWEFVDEKKKYFEFNHVAPGEYILVFNDQDRLDTDVPFPRTFFRNAPDLTRAEHITVAPGAQLLNEDIELTGGAPTRRLRIHVTFEGGGEPANSYLSVHASKGEQAFPSAIENNLYELNVLFDSKYTINAATLFCDPETASETLELDGASAAAELTITVPRTECKAPPIVKEQ